MPNGNVDSAEYKNAQYEPCKGLLRNLWTLIFGEHDPSKDGYVARLWVQYHGSSGGDPLEQFTMDLNFKTHSEALEMIQNFQDLLRKYEVRHS